MRFESLKIEMIEKIYNFLEIPVWLNAHPKNTMFNTLKEYTCTSLYLSKKTWWIEISC